MDKGTVFEDFGFENPPHPYWMASTESKNYPALEQDIKVQGRRLMYIPNQKNTYSK